MRRNVFTLVIVFLFCAGLAVFVNNLESAGTTKWVVAMQFCKENMVKDAKEEMSAGKSEFDQFCKKAGKRRAIDAQCKNGKLEVKCR